MTTLVANRVVDSLRMCGNTTVCAGCPHQILGPGACIRALQNDAAEMIDEQSQLIDEQEAKLEALRKLVKNHLS